MARIGLAIALSYLFLDMIKIYRFPNGGGSISLGSMIPINDNLIYLWSI